MRLRSIEALVARQRVIDNSNLQEIRDAHEVIQSAYIKYPWWSMEFAYLMGVVDGKRAERVKHKPADAALDRPIHWRAEKPQEASE